MKWAVRRERTKHISSTQVRRLGSKSDIMIGMHERAIHLAKKATKVEIKDEVKGDTKKLKRIKRKVTTMFAENESRDEFLTKEGEV